MVSSFGYTDEELTLSLELSIKHNDIWAFLEHNCALQDIIATLNREWITPDEKSRMVSITGGVSTQRAQPTKKASVQQRALDTFDYLDQLKHADRGSWDRHEHHAFAALRIVHEVDLPIFRGQKDRYEKLDRAITLLRSAIEFWYRKGCKNFGYLLSDGEAIAGGINMSKKEAAPGFVNSIFRSQGLKTELDEFEPAIDEQHQFAAPMRLGNVVKSMRGNFTTKLSGQTDALEGTSKQGKPIRGPLTRSTAGAEGTEFEEANNYVPERFGRGSCIKLKVPKQANDLSHARWTMPPMPEYDTTKLPFPSNPKYIRFPLELVDRYAGSCQLGDVLYRFAHWTLPHSDPRTVSLTLQLVDDNGNPMDPGTCKLHKTTSDIRALESIMAEDVVKMWEDINVWNEKSVAAWTKAKERLAEKKPERSSTSLPETGKPSYIRKSKKRKLSSLASGPEVTNNPTVEQPDLGSASKGISNGTQHVSTSLSTITQTPKVIESSGCQAQDTQLYYSDEATIASLQARKEDFREKISQLEKRVTNAQKEIERLREQERHADTALVALQGLADGVGEVSTHTNAYN